MSYTPNKRNNNSDDTPEWVSWMVIALLIFGGAWFIGLPWLAVKLFGSDKKKSTHKVPSLNVEQESAVEEKSVGEKARDITLGSLTKTPGDSKLTRFLLASVGIFLGILGVSLSIGALENIAYGFTAGRLFGLLSALAIAVGGGAMVWRSVKSGRAGKRYTKYLAVIGSSKAYSIDALCKKLGFPKKQVREDLDDMLEKGLFGSNAYVNEELGYLFLSSEADEEISSARKAALQKAAEARATKTEDLYSSILRQIRDVNDRIADKPMSDKIDNIEEITRGIFDAVKKDPEKVHKIDKFLNYYLPTTLKLLESYAQLEKTCAAGENVSESMRSIENAMDNIEGGFRNLLDSMYASNVIDIKSDIDVMQKMMNSDGSTARHDFAMGGSAAQTQEK